MRSALMVMKVTFVALVALNGVALAAEVDTKRLIEARSEPQNWLTYGGTYDAWRYSPLDQIDRKNVKDLVPAWIFQTGKDDGGFSGARPWFHGDAQCFLNAQTSSSSRTRPIGASTTYWPTTCETPCPTRLSSLSPALHW